MSHTPKERSEEFLAEISHKWRLNDLGQLVVNNKYQRSGEVGSVFLGTWDDSVGYRRVWVQGSLAREQHVVWYLNTGEWPKQPLDHIDGDRRNNHLDNLRLVTMKQNNRAFRKTNKNASSKWRGVWCKGSGWQSGIRVDRKSYYLGMFTCEKEAALAYNYGAIKYGFSPEALNQVFADDEVEVT